MKHVKSMAFLWPAHCFNSVAHSNSPFRSRLSVLSGGRPALLAAPTLSLLSPLNKLTPV